MLIGLHRLTDEEQRGFYLPLSLEAFPSNIVFHFVFEKQWNFLKSTYTHFLSETNYIIVIYMIGDQEFYQRMKQKCILWES